MSKISITLKDYQKYQNNIDLYHVEVKIYDTSITTSTPKIVDSFNLSKVQGSNGVYEKDITVPKNGLIVINDRNDIYLPFISNSRSNILEDQGKYILEPFTGTKTGWEFTTLKIMNFKRGAINYITPNLQRITHKFGTPHGGLNGIPLRFPTGVMFNIVYDPMGARIGNFSVNGRVYLSSIKNNSKLVREITSGKVSSELIEFNNQITTFDFKSSTMFDPNIKTDPEDAIVELAYKNKPAEYSELQKPHKLPVGEYFIRAKKDGYKTSISKIISISEAGSIKETLIKLNIKKNYTLKINVIPEDANATLTLINLDGEIIPQSKWSDIQEGTYLIKAVSEKYEIYSEQIMITREEFNITKEITLQSKPLFPIRISYSPDKASVIIKDKKTKQVVFTNKNYKINPIYIGIYRSKKKSLASINSNNSVNKWGGFIVGSNKNRNDGIKTDYLENLKTLPNGEYEIEVSCEGYDSKSVTIEVDRSKNTAPAPIRLEASNQIVNYTTNPEGCTIEIIDNDKVVHNNGESLKPGKYTVKITKPGEVEDYIEEIDVYDHPIEKSVILKKFNNFIIVNVSEDEQITYQVFSHTTKSEISIKDPQPAGMYTILLKNSATGDYVSIDFELNSYDKTINAGFYFSDNNKFGGVVTVPRMIIHDCLYCETSIVDSNPNLAISGKDENGYTINTEKKMYKYANGYNYDPYRKYPSYKPVKEPFSKSADTLYLSNQYTNPKQTLALADLTEIFKSRLGNQLIINTFDQSNKKIDILFDDNLDLAKISYKLSKESNGDIIREEQALTEDQVQQLGGRTRQFTFENLETQIVYRFEARYPGHFPISELIFMSPCDTIYKIQPFRKAYTKLYINTKPSGATIKLFDSNNIALEDPTTITKDGYEHGYSIPAGKIKIQFSHSLISEQVEREIDKVYGGEEFININLKNKPGVIGDITVPNKGFIYDMSEVDDIERVVLLSYDGERDHVSSIDTLNNKYIQIYDLYYNEDGTTINNFKLLLDNMDLINHSLESNIGDITKIENGSFIIGIMRKNHGPVYCKLSEFEGDPLVTSIKKLKLGKKQNKINDNGCKLVQVEKASKDNFKLFYITEEDFESSKGFKRNTLINIVNKGNLFKGELGAHASTKFTMVLPNRAYLITTSDMICTHVNNQEYQLSEEFKEKTKSFNTKYKPLLFIDDDVYKIKLT